MNQILINQQENQLININNKEVQNITLNQNENQLIGINNSETQNIDINQKDNQLIYISNEGSAIGISNVLVNGVSVVSGNVAYVVVPTKTSELENDSGYLTRETDPTVPRYIKSITLNDINNWNNKQDTLVSGTNIKTINNTSLLGSGNIEIEGSSYTAGTGIEITNDNVINNRITSYNSLTDLPTIPTKTSELLNDNNFVESSDLASVAFSGSYLDLVDDPVIPQNTSDLYNDSGFITNTVNDLTNYTTTTNLNSMLNNKQDTLVSGTNIKTINNTSLLGSGNINISGGGGTPTDVQINGTSITSNNVANILTESAYDSTNNKIATVSDLPTVNDGTLTIQKNGTTIDTFTANSSSNKTINVTVPTATSDLTNDSNFAVTNANNNFSASQSINGTITATDHLDTQYIELSTSIPYIDFHYNYSSADFTSRIAEYSSGNLTMENNLGVNGTISATSSLITTGNDTGVICDNQTVGRKVKYTVSGGGNAGIYDMTNSNWIIQSATNQNVYIPHPLFVNSKSVATMKELYSNTTGSTNVNIGESTNNYNLYIIVWGIDYGEKRADILIPGFSNFDFSQFATTDYWATYRFTVSGNNISMALRNIHYWANTGKMYKIIGVKF